MLNLVRCNSNYSDQYNFSYEKLFDVLWNNVIQFLLKNNIDVSHYTPEPGK